MTTTAYKSSIGFFAAAIVGDLVTTGERIVPDFGDKIQCTFV